MSVKFCLSALLLIFSFLFLSGAHAASDVTFKNFSREIILSDQQQDYLINDFGVHVTLANKLIVKADSAMDPHFLMKLDSRITKAKKIYTGHGFNYLSVELKTANSVSSVLKELQKNSAVYLVQPDILQLKQNASASSVNNDAVRQPYLEQLGITKLWNRTKGDGVRVAIIDDGIDLTHPALAKVHSEFLYDTQSHQLSAQPHAAIDSHGTQVAGVIFATQVDNTFQGIAPDAQLIAIRQPDSWTSNTLLAFQLAALAKADVINCSWTTPFLLEPIADVVNDLTTYGRNGKGIAVVFSAGNEGVPIAQLNTEATINSAITVGALDAQGVMLASSNYGIGVDVSVYGAGVKSTANQSLYHSFSGTSLSAAIVSGLAALLISEQPEIHLNLLEQKIQQHTQLASTADAVDSHLITASIK